MIPRSLIAADRRHHSCFGPERRGEAPRAGGPSRPQNSSQNFQTLRKQAHTPAFAQGPWAARDPGRGITGEGSGPPF